MAKPNHGSSVSTVAHEAQDARAEGGPRGIGSVVSAAARDKSQPEPEPDFADGVITVVNADGTSDGEFTTFADALAAADDGDTLQVGAGTYEEAFKLEERLTIIGEEGAIVDGSNISSTAGTQSTILLSDGFSGGSISGLTVFAVQGGQALLNNTGEDVNGVALIGNTFNAGDNTSGSLVYLNPGADGFNFTGNTFQGGALTGSPLLGIEADDVLVENNTFGEVGGTYPKVEVFAGPNGTTSDVVFIDNTGWMV